MQIDVVSQADIYYFLFKMKSFKLGLFKNSGNQTSGGLLF